MAWILEVRVWIAVPLLLSLIHPSEEACEVFKKTTNIFRIERVLYRYIACINMTANSNLHDEILSVFNSSSQYLEIVNSSIPEITKNMFQFLNFTQVTIEAKVQQVREKAFERSNIPNVILDNNEIRKVEVGAFKSVAIYVLSLKNNSLSEIASGTFSGLVNLRKLTLENNQISTISTDSFNDLAGLNELNLAFNNLNDLQPHLFDKLKNVQTIHLNNNHLKQLPADIFSKNGILQYLSVHNNLISNLDATSFPLTILYVNAAENHLKWFNMSGLINLNRVVLDSNILTTTLNCLNNLPSLGYLHLNHNFLGTSAFNGSFEHLSNLSVLEIDNNNLVKTDFKIFRNLENLQGLSLAENKLMSVDLRDSSTSIKLLNLSRNSLSEVKNLWKLGNLLKLELSYNDLKEVTFDMLTNMSSLQQLWLRHNSIRELHLGCFRDLKALTMLNLSYNRITNISSGIFTGLNSLIELDISQNYLVNFDEDSFHNTRNIRFLNIAHNNLSNVNIRRILSHTIWLREINLNGNNWTCKMLIDIEQGSKIISFVGGNSFNVSNVYGVPCIDSSDEEETPHTNVDIYLPNILGVMNSTVMYTKDISFKMNIANSVMIICLILVCLKYLFEKYSSRIAAAKQFVYQQTANEQEIQLL